jgi:HEAT repeat protein
MAVDGFCRLQAFYHLPECCCGLATGCILPRCVLAQFRHSGPSYRRDVVDISRMDSLPAGSSASRRMQLKMAAQPDLLILKLMQKLGDANHLVRRNAAGALRLQGLRAKAAIPALSILLKDQDPRVRNEAERAIDHLKLAAA